MVKLFVFLFSEFPLLLAWLYLLVAIFGVVVNIRQIMRQDKLSIGWWMFTILNAGYAIGFLVMRVFFFNCWKHTFTVLGLLAIIISVIWSSYCDKCAGKRWWYW